MRVLIVEDKRSLAGHIGRALESEGHTTSLAYDGDEALRLGKTNNFDLLILDVMLDSGADDYLTKPFALDVLLAKVRAAARRAPAPIPHELQFDGLILRPHLFQLQRGARVASLTRTECALMEILIRRARTVVPHGVLIDEGWSSDADVSYDSLYVFIRALRAKITHPGEYELLHTVRGVGYSLRSDVC
jgi:DNA-binding response OmpR family regulator